MSESKSAGQRSFIGLHMVVIAIWSSWLISQPATAELRVYVDSPGIPRALPLGTTAFDLFVSNGTSPTTSGSPCLNGNGDELCAWSVKLQASGGVQLVAFTPAALSGTVWRLEPTDIRANGISAISGKLGAEKIGTLHVGVTDVGAIQVVADSISTGVSADLQVRQIAATVVALPEPGVIPGLAACGLFLAALARRSSSAKTADERLAVSPRRDTPTSTWSS